MPPASQTEAAVHGRRSDTSLFAPLHVHSAEPEWSKVFLEPFASSCSMCFMSPMLLKNFRRGGAGGRAAESRVVQSPPRRRGPTPSDDNGGRLRRSGPERLAGPD